MHFAAAFFLWMALFFTVEFVLDVRRPAGAERRQWLLATLAWAGFCLLETLR